MDKNKLGEVLCAKVNPRQVAENKFHVYQDYIIKRLQDVIEAVKDTDVAAIDDLCFYSPAGDCMGCDNSCIDFGYGEKFLDITEAIRYLSWLLDYAGGVLPLDAEYREEK